MHRFDAGRFSVHEMCGPEQIAGHDVGDDGKQHQKHRDPKDPAVVHSLPARATRMMSLVLVHGSKIENEELGTRKEEPIAVNAKNSYQRKNGEPGR